MTLPAHPTVLVGVFEERRAAEQAVEDLERAGFAKEQLGYAIRDAGSPIVGGTITDASPTKDTRGAVNGAIGGGIVGGILAAAVALVLPGVGPVLFAGVLASFVGGALAGVATGGIIGALTGLGMSEDEARLFEADFQQGRAIVAVKPGFRAAEAAQIMQRHGAHDLHNEVRGPLHNSGPLAAP